MKPITIAIILIISTTAAAQNYTVISKQQYQKHFIQSRETITKIIRVIKKIKSLNKKIILIHDYFKNRPYGITGISGEGDWQPGSWSYRTNAPHIKQDPVYRTDRFNCQTLVQIVLALLHSDNLKSFERNYLKISYGAAHIPSNQVHYYNRNSFISADFNPINQRNGFIKDVTTTNSLAKHTSATIDRAKWFKYKQKPSDTVLAVRVLNKKDGPKMAARWLNNYPCQFIKFKPKLVKISYIPKTVLVNKNYQPNYQIINMLPTPSIIEIVRDAKKWKIKQKIGTELNVSHVGILYRQNFRSGKIISNNIVCTTNRQHQKSCRVIPHICHKKICREIMMLQATNAYPKHFYNRVISMLLTDYLTQKINSRHAFMDSPSILGIHLEQITPYTSNE